MFYMGNEMFLDIKVKMWFWESSLIKVVFEGNKICRKILLLKFLFFVCFFYKVVG